MSKATARVEFSALAKANGFAVVHEHGRLVAYYSGERNEGFQVVYDGNAFESATWHAPTRYVAVVDRRAPGEHSKPTESAPMGVSLTSTTKRRSVGMGVLRAGVETLAGGMEVGYMEIKRRIKEKSWRKS